MFNRIKRWFEEPIRRPTSVNSGSLYLRDLEKIKTLDDDDLLLITDVSENRSKQVSLGQLKKHFKK
jgi:hypothetical protein